MRLKFVSVAFRSLKLVAKHCKCVIISRFKSCMFPNDDRYADSKLGLVFTALALLTAALIRTFEPVPLVKFVALCLTLEGWALLVYTFITCLLAPPPPGRSSLEWLLFPSPEATVLFLKQPAFYGALLCLFLGHV